MFMIPSVGGFNVLSLSTGLAQGIALRLTAHGGRAAELRSAPAPDFQGNKIPAEATDGSVHWIRIDEGPMMGRLVQLQRNNAMASSYQCQACPCGASYNSLFTSPTTGSNIPSNNIPYFANECDLDCNGVPYYYEITTLSSWTSSNTSLRTVNDTTQKGLVRVIAGGTATITATHQGIARLWDGFVCHYTLVQRSGSSSCNGRVPTWVVKIFDSGNTNTTRCPFNPNAKERSREYGVFDSMGQIPLPLTFNWILTEVVVSGPCEVQTGDYLNGINAFDDLTINHHS